MMDVFKGVIVASFFLAFAITVDVFAFSISVLIGAVATVITIAYITATIVCLLDNDDWRFWRY